MKNLYEKILNGFFAALLIAAGAGTYYVANAQTVTGAFTVQMEEGMRGNEITRLQTFLRADASIYPEGLVTGYFGSLTRTAVIRFQARYGIAQVGRVGPVTLAKINELVASGNYGGVGSDIAPVISGVTMDANASNQVTIRWNTQQNAIGTVYYSATGITLTEAAGPGAKVGISGIAVPDGDSMTTSHSAVISGLTPGVTYWFVIHSVDAQGDESITLPQAVTVR